MAFACVKKTLPLLALILLATACQPEDRQAEEKLEAISSIERTIRE